jgi:hypothetical protein
MITMRIPQQVSERVKEAPAQALRAVFSGIGQVLLVADRIKNRANEPARSQPGTPQRHDQPGQSTPVAPKDESRWRSLDETGNVRLLSQDEVASPARPPAAESGADLGPAGQSDAPGPRPASDTEPAAVPEPAHEAEQTATAEPADQAEQTATAEPADEAGLPGSEPVAVPEPRSGAETGPDEAALPVPNYDDLTVASLRARLRNLDSAQVRTLLDYEKANAGRAAVLTMYERRIAKLESLEA